MSKTLSHYGVGALIVAAILLVSIVAQSAFAFETVLVSPVSGPANTPSVLIKLGIGTTTPFGALSILGKHTDSDVTFPYVMIASSTPTGTSTLFKIGRSGQITQGGRVPTGATSTGSGTGSIPITVSGSANFVYINLTTGAAPALGGVIATITMPEACPTATVPVLGYGNTLSAATSSAAVYASSTSATTFNIVNAGTAALSASSIYIWNVQVGCY